MNCGAVALISHIVSAIQIPVRQHKLPVREREHVRVWQMMYTQLRQRLIAEQKIPVAGHKVHGNARLSQFAQGAKNRLVFAALEFLIANPVFKNIAQQINRRGFPAGALQKT